MYDIKRLPDTVSNVVLVKCGLCAIKSTDRGYKQEDHHDYNGDCQLAQEGCIYFSDKLK